MKASIALALSGASAFAVSRLIRAYRVADEAAMARLASVERHFVDTSFGDVDFVVEGNGEPLLLIHGIFGGSDASMLYSGDLFTGRRLIAPSRFGYLGSAMPAAATPAMQADAFAELLDALGVERVDVVAYSAGSPSAIQLALRHPERVAHLVIMSGDLPGATAVAPPAATKLVFRSDVIMWLATVVARPKLMRFVGGLPSGATPTESEHETLLAILDSIFPVRDRAAGVLFDSFVSNPAVNSYPLEELGVPTLIAHARDDTLASFDAAQDAARRIPDAQFLAVDRGGHLMLGQTEAVRAGLAAFLSSEPTRGPIPD